MAAAALFDMQKGPVIGIFHEYTDLGKVRSIQAAKQIKWLKCKVDDRSNVVGGVQRIEAPDGYVFPLSIESGLLYMQPIQVPTDDDLQQYTHVFFTSPDIWDASVLDHGITPSLLDEINLETNDSWLQDSIFDEFEIFNNKWYSTWMCSGWESLQRLGSILTLYTSKLKFSGY